MSKFKEYVLNRGGNIFYTYTDSLVIDSALPLELIGENLEQLKLEKRTQKGYLISSKNYCNTSDC